MGGRRSGGQMRPAARSMGARRYMPQRMAEMMGHTVGIRQHMSDVMEAPPAAPRKRRSSGMRASVRSRRSLLNWFLASGFGALLTSIFYPLARYLVPPEVGESAAASVVLDLKATDLRPNSGRIFKFGNQPGILIRTPTGDLRAFTAICTHLACTVQYRSDLSHIWCACHNGHYDLTGRNIAGPPPRPLAPFAVMVRGDRIVVSRSAAS